MATTTRIANDAAVAELKKFAKETFDLDNILSTASELKYTKGIKDVLFNEWKEPSDELVRLLAGRVYSGRMTQSVRDQFGDLVKKAFAAFVNDRVKSRLQSALERDPVVNDTQQEPEGEEGSEPDGSRDKIVTTIEEIEGYHIVKSIVRSVVSSDRVVMRDTQSYCGVLLDDNNRKPVCRMFFNQSQKYLGLFDADKNCTRQAIGSLDDIYEHADQLCKTAQQYDQGTSQNVDA